MTTTAQPPPPPATDAHAATAPETLEIIYQASKDSRAAAAAQISTLDTKASFVLGAASLLASGITGVQATVSGHTNRYYISGPDGHLAVTLTAADIVHILTIPGAIIYLWVVVYAWRAYRVRKFKTIDPTKLERYTGTQFKEWRVKKMLIQAMALQYQINQDKIDRKSLAVERALQGLLVEVVYLGFLLFLLAVL